MQLLGETPPVMFFLRTTLTSSMASERSGVSKHLFWKAFSSASFRSPSLSVSQTFTPHIAYVVKYKYCQVYTGCPYSPPPNLTFEQIKVNKRAFGHVYLWPKEEIFGASENFHHFVENQGLGWYFKILSINLSWIVPKNRLDSDIFCHYLQIVKEVEINE